jgi:FtsH-binding integral membrane protein
MNNQGLVQTGSTLNKFFAKIYAFLALGIVASAVTTIVLVNFFTEFFVTLLYSNGLYLGLCLVELVLVYYLGAVKSSENTAKAIAGFVAYSIMNGITISVVLYRYTETSIIGAFLSAAATFGAMSLVGVYTKKDLTRIGQAGYSAVLGIIISLVLNFFVLHSRPVEVVISLITILVFVGITAYENQLIKETYKQSNGQVATTTAIFFALQLYLDLINLFLAFLSLFGDED